MGLSEYLSLLGDLELLGVKVLAMQVAMVMVVSGLVSLATFSPNAEEWEEVVPLVKEVVLLVLAGHL